MIFDTSQRLYLAVIREIANLVEPDTGQDERPISTVSFDLTIIQAQCLNDSLKERFDGLFAIVAQVFSNYCAIIRIADSTLRMIFRENFGRVSKW